MTSPSSIQVIPNVLCIFVASVEHHGVIPRTIALQERINILDDQVRDHEVAQSSNAVVESAPLAALMFMTPPATELIAWP